MKHPDKLPLAKLSTITTKIGSGATPRGGKESYKDSGITLIRSLNVYDFHFEYDGLAFIDDDQAEELTNVEVREHDILLNITGASVARCCMVPVRLLPARVNQHVALVRVSPAIADPHYVLYCINSPNHKRRLLTLAQGGATREALTKETIENFEIPLPPLPAQRKIAAILSAYDDLIENNTRRIRILEEMAQLLYREWFVHFRFPGREGVKMKNGVLEGWEKGVFSDIAEMSREGVNPGKFEKETFAHYSIPAFDEGQMPVTEQGTVIKSTKFLVGENCVLLSKINPRIPRVWLPVLEGAHRAIASTEFLVLTPKPPATRAFLFNLCWNPDFLGEFAGLALGTSTSHQRVKPDDLLKMPVSVPAPALLARYDETVMPMLSLAHTLRVKNANLRRTRDLLLPRLVSGEVEV